MQAHAQAELILRVVGAFPLPASQPCVTAFAEGLGGAAFLRAFSRDPTPFAPHHVLINVVIGDIPPKLRSRLESRGADLAFYGCERFYKGQPNVPLGNCSTLLMWAYEPGIAERLLFTVLYKDPVARERTPRRVPATRPAITRVPPPPTHPPTTRCASAPRCRPHHVAASLPPLLPPLLPPRHAPDRPAAAPRSRACGRSRSGPAAS